ncbi:hypothetical protein, partial [Desulfosoma sp.]|uniref:hypothetical protein n=1 Tax=Desulfosoma sp. TaxID=2603217 RepID=UPI004049EDEB
GFPLASGMNPFSKEEDLGLVDVRFSETHYKDLKWLEEHDGRKPQFEPPRLRNLGQRADDHQVKICSEEPKIHL